EDLGLGALSDREHRDHRRDAEQDAERRERRAQLVVPHRLDGGAHRERDMRRKRAPQLRETLSVELHVVSPSWRRERRRPALSTRAWPARASRAPFAAPVRRRPRASSSVPLWIPAGG